MTNSPSTQRLDKELGKNRISEWTWEVENIVKPLREGKEKK